MIELIFIDKIWDHSKTNLMHITHDLSKDSAIVRLTADDMITGSCSHTATLHHRTLQVQSHGSTFLKAPSLYSHGCVVYMSLQAGDHKRVHFCTSIKGQHEAWFG